MSADEQDQQPLLIPAAPALATIETEELDRDIASLRGVVFWVVVGLLFITVALNLFLWRQVQNVRSELIAERRQIEEYSKADPAVRDLMLRLRAFAATHPDFQPIMAKYGPAPTNVPAGKK
jgi:hypothetical protein